MFVSEYSKAFNVFYRNLDQGFVNPLANFNVGSPTYWVNWKKACDLTDWIYKNHFHPEDYWKYAYDVITETGTPTISFNTFGMDWLLDAVKKKRDEKTRILQAKSYGIENYTCGNVYYVIYYQAVINRVREKYGTEYKSIIMSMIEDKFLLIEIFTDLANLLEV